MPKIVLNGAIAKSELLNGLNQAADIITITAGPLGRNVVIEQKNDLAPLIINDGVTIAQNINLEDPILNVGASIIKQVAIETNEIAGDGTTTSVILAHKLINAAYQLTSKNVNPIILKKQILACSEFVVEKLHAQAKQIGYDTNLITHVASIAANSASIGHILAKAFASVGSEGIINVEETQNVQSSLELSEGFKFKGGFLSRYMINDLTRNKVVQNGAKILIYNSEINNLKPFIGLLEKASQYKQPLLIVAKDFSDEVIAAFALNKIRNVANIIAVKPTNYFHNLNNLLDDLAAFCNTQVFTHQTKLPDWEQLVLLERIIIDKTYTTIINSQTQGEYFLQHLNNLKLLKKNTTDRAEQADLEKRIANLEAKVALIKVSGQTEIEQKEKKYRIEDALNATRHAIDSGVVPGGGAAFFRVWKELQVNQKLKNDHPHGWEVCNQALSAPLMTISENSGINSAEVFQKMQDESDPWIGLDAENNKWVDLWTAGIIDPYTVSHTAWIKAISIACALITTEAVVVEKVEKNRFVFPNMD